MKHFLKLCTVLCIIFISQSAVAQTTCDADYARACQDELQVAADLRLLEEQEKVVIARRKAAQCKLADISVAKQKLIACMAANRNSINLDQLQSKLIELMNELNRVKAQPVIVPQPCVGGNCG